MNLLPEMWTYSEYVSHRFMDRFQKGKYCEPLIDDALLYIPFVNDKDFAFLAETSYKIIIAFSGTKNLRAMINNFDAYPLGEGMILDGFYRSWEYYKDAFDRFIRDNFHVRANDFSGIKKELFITGHSRGGALASLCARHFAKNRRKTNTCYSFGAPPQGTKQYVDQYNQLPPLNIRCVNGYDIVPTMLLPKSLGFLHQNYLHWFPQPLWHRWFHKIRDHYYSNYTKAILKYCRQVEDQEGAMQMRRVLKRARP